MVRIGQIYWLVESPLNQAISAAATKENGMIKSLAYGHSYKNAIIILA